MKGITCQINVDAKEVANLVTKKIMDKLDKQEKPPLLQIELADINSVPTVFYKGEEINGKIKVSFDWETNDEVGHNPTHIHIEHVDSDSKGIDTKTIQHNKLPIT